jgi:hypothetical protein
MPEISRFFGMVITMYFSDHNPPHFHVRHGSRRGRFTVEPPMMVEGDLGPRARNLVLEWTNLHQSELLVEWDNARNQKPLFQIDPLE